MRSTKLALTCAIVVAGVTGSARPSLPVNRPGQGPSSRPVRVLLAALGREATFRPPTAWRLLDIHHRVIAEGRGGDQWQMEREGTRLRMVSPSGTRTALYDGTAVLELSDTATAPLWNGRHYRGVLLFIPADTALLVVNRIDVEDYLRGVVSLETGTSAPDAHAAVEAQAVAARSFTYTRMLYSAQRDFDLTASPNDQVYGGVEAESFIGDLAVAATAGWVLSSGGRVVSAPYHSTCGGSTAVPSEIWRSPDESYLRSVSDRIPGTARFYCDISPRFRWRRTLSAETISAAIARYARSYVRLPIGPLGDVHEVHVEGRTTSGRVSAITIQTTRARFRLQGNDVRYVLRAVGGEILPSTYFSVDPVNGERGRLEQLVVEGQGNGHGVGMCQWGAVGRARAGQDFRTILRVYYPGAQLVRAP